MSFTKKYKLTITIILTALMSHLPNVVMSEELAAQKGEMIATSVVVNDFNRQKMQQEVLTYLNKDEVKQKLIASGISSDEAAARVASLSNEELQNMSKQVQQARYGGDILVAILLVILIIFLVKRI